MSYYSSETPPSASFTGYPPAPASPNTTNNFGAHAAGPSNASATFNYPPPGTNISPHQIQSSSYTSLSPNQYTPTSYSHMQPSQAHAQQYGHSSLALPGMYSAPNIHYQAPPPQVTQAQQPPQQQSFFHAQQPYAQTSTQSMQQAYAQPNAQPVYGQIHNANADMGSYKPAPIPTTHSGPPPAGYPSASMANGVPQQNVSTGYNPSQSYYNHDESTFAPATQSTGAGVGAGAYVPTGGSYSNESSCKKCHGQGLTEKPHKECKKCGMSHYAHKKQQQQQQQQSSGQGGGAEPKCKKCMGMGAGMTKACKECGKTYLTGAAAMLGGGAGNGGSGGGSLSGLAKLGGSGGGGLSSLLALAKK
ncbi:hypothetical protein SARC_11682 [Sphaeroforma arctica JP610]|uniref:Uncharacterized protein n=1 Tax=Sphaeroforma arctica JP610 TaxID=667725 RepID=A0A0L0FH34_9EUKA|nr:hypothetical protein SARC_11682 [Sphaeroforma arctica JP610]KNC75796.1 hypothetical protein SARC_11682 [Sphaeroforma arctica JP610]|eukprot:XP_014149698.1 hypothetical protein SARC_11682 [Sphaeroforma arctica JP610]